mmetsp:Transcript_30721/g.84400  ORF Transcript_30721/g.84400 Transcript_30721/m.84400 type:complete len:305 (+) Transcript_30721:739-1653(+)
MDTALHSSRHEVSEKPLVLCFSLVIQLRPCASGPNVQEHDRVGELLGGVAEEGSPHRGETAEQKQVQGHLPLHVRALHLYRHLASAVLPTVHLPQRGSGDGLRGVVPICRAQTIEDVLGRRRETVQHNLVSFIPWERRTSVAELLQFPKGWRRQKVWARGQRLPKFDEGGATSLEQNPQFHSALALRCRLAKLPALPSAVGAPRVRHDVVGQVGLPPSHGPWSSPPVLCDGVRVVRARQLGRVGLWFQQRRGRRHCYGGRANRCTDCAPPFGQGSDAEESPHETASRPGYSRQILDHRHWAEMA